MTSCYHAQRVADLLVASRPAVGYVAPTSESSDRIAADLCPPDPQ